VGSEVTHTVKAADRLVFQTNPRGVGGLFRCRRRTHHYSFRPTLVGSEDEQPQVHGLPRWFQTNPRGVGGVLTNFTSTCRKRFRPTLVGSEGSYADGGAILDHVSDQPSWGRRREFDDIRAFEALVSDQPSWGRRRSSNAFFAVATPVSDQPSWGRRLVQRWWGDPSYMVSDQPSWGRREQSVAVDLHDRFQTNPRGVGGMNRPMIEISIMRFRPTLVGSEATQGDTPRS